MIVNLLIITIFPAAMAFAAVNDLFSMTVPNWISLMLVAGFAMLAPAVGLSWSGLGIHVALGVGALVVTFAMFAFGWIGGGDAKLFAATCLWMGPEGTLLYAIYASLLGGLLTVLIIVFRSVPLPATLYSRGWLLRLHDSKEGVPYGIALAAAALMIYPQTPFMAALGG